MLPRPVLLFPVACAGQVSTPVVGVTSTVWCLGAVYGFVCAVRPGTSPFTFYDFVYFLSYVKLGVTLVKYVPQVGRQSTRGPNLAGVALRLPAKRQHVVFRPQVYVNYKRRSTVGWNVWNVILDFQGGALSVVQQLMDSGISGKGSRGCLSLPPWCARRTHVC